MLKNTRGEGRQELDFVERNDIQQDKSLLDQRDTQSVINEKSTFQHIELEIQ